MSILQYDFENRRFRGSVGAVVGEVSLVNGTVCGRTYDPRSGVLPWQPYSDLLIAVEAVERHLQVARDLAEND